MRVDFIDLGIISLVLKATLFRPRSFFSLGINELLPLRVVLNTLIVEVARDADVEDSGDDGWRDSSC